MNYLGSSLVYRKVSILCALAAIAFCHSAFAQTFSSSITGLIHDPSGAVVSGAKVELKNTETNDVRDATSSADGSYQFQNLDPGTYEVTVQARGFSTYTKSNMLLPAHTAAAVNVDLQVGSTNQKVDVTAQAVLVDTQTANNSVTMDSQLIQALPNATRSPLNFVFSLAGTTEAQGGMTSRSQTFDQNFSMFGLNGGRSG